MIEEKNNVQIDDQNGNSIKPLLSSRLLKFRAFSNETKKMMDWCWICHLKTSRGTLHTIYFPNCRRTLHFYFFRKKINENCNRKILRDNRNLKPNFVENLQRQFSAEKLCVIFETENQTLWKTFKNNSRISAI